MPEQLVVLCQKCNINSAEEPHTCPYKKDIHNDQETLCNCCESCQDECADDI